MEMIINDFKVFENFEIEREEKMKSLCSESMYSETNFLNTLTLFNRDSQDIRNALDYAKSLDFSNNYLKSSYLSHPLRLASFLIRIEPGINSDYIVIALLHNVLETTEITIQEIKLVFGDNIAEGINILTVDRKVPFLSIQESYYKKIFDYGISLTLVKLLDKIDNLFVLGLNPDDEIRSNYIEEVRIELLPFAYKYNNQLGKYLEELLDVTLELGYSENLKKRIQTYQKSL